MSWNRKKLRRGRNIYYSLSKKLRQERKINNDFETMLAGLTLEEVILFLCLDIFAFSSFTCFFFRCKKKVESEGLPGKHASGSP